MDDLGDLSAEEMRAALHRTADLIADYLAGGVEEHPVVPAVEPGELAALLPAEPPAAGEPMAALLDDYERLVVPHTTHWNHPGFHGYFAISGSAPGVIAESLAAALNVNAMLWQSGPAATELERRCCDWLRQMMALPEELRGHINDTASTSSLVALAAARESLGSGVRERGLTGHAPLALYISEHTHSSIDKAAIVLGLGTDSVRRIAVDEQYRMVPEALEAAIREDLGAGRRPLAVVATTGTTSTTSLDPVDAIADLCARHGLWLHVDAAYGGSAAIVPELRPLFAGMERADSLVVNPHKWLFVPVDCSLLYVRDEALLRRAFSLVPEYLKTRDGAADNLMDLGFQLGRRFRALKLWMVIRAFGVDGLVARIRRHCELARRFAEGVAATDGWELMAPVPLALVCFRATEAVAGSSDGEAQDRFNEALMAAINADGRSFLSHTRLGGRYTLRLAVGNIRTEKRHLDDLWQRLLDTAEDLRSGGSS